MLWVGLLIAAISPLIRRPHEWLNLSANRDNGTLLTREKCERMRTEEGEKKMTKRIEVARAPTPLEEYSKHFDPLFGKSNQREGFRQYLEGVLLPSERHKTLTGLVNTEPIVGAQVPRAQKLQWFLSESDWDERKVQAERLKLLREDPATAPDAQGVLVIDETGDRKDGHKTAHVGRQYLGNLGKIDNGVVSVTSLWADEQVYYPLEIEPYTPESYFAKGRNDPAFRTKLKIALQLVQQAIEQGWVFRAMVADNFYGEDRGLRSGLQKLKVPYVMALKPSHTWWHPEGVAGSLKDVAYEAGWKSATSPGKWRPITRTFRDGSTQAWWVLEIEAGPYGSDKTERAMVATTNPQTLPDLTTWYLVTNLPTPSACLATQPQFAPASLEEVIRLYGLRMWVEQSYKQVKHALGWSQYQVRSDQAIRRHWQLVCCAFSFCWYHASHPNSSETAEEREATEAEAPSPTHVPAPAVGTGKKNQPGHKRATARVLADGPASGTRLVGALDHAETLLESVWRSAPTGSFAKLV
jgi:SRSO17 transposase